MFSLITVLDCFWLFLIFAGPDETLGHIIFLPSLVSISMTFCWHGESHKVKGLAFGMETLKGAKSFVSEWLCPELQLTATSLLALHLLYNSIQGGAVAPLEKQHNRLSYTKLQIHLCVYQSRSFYWEILSQKHDSLNQTVQRTGFSSSNSTI